MRGYSARDKIIYWMFEDKTPLTKLLVVANVATYFPIMLFNVMALPVYGGFSSLTAGMFPWTIVTYPFVGMYCCGATSVLSLLFACLWLLGVGGSLERAWGTRTFAVFFFAVAGLSAAGLFLGSMIAHANASATGLWLPIAGVTVAFALLNPEMQSLFMFVIPLKMKYIAVLVVAFVLVSYGRDSVIVAMCALAGCAFAYWYVKSGKQYGFSTGRSTRRDNVVQVYQREGLGRKMNPLNWLKERRDRKRLKDLFRKSGMED